MYLYVYGYVYVYVYFVCVCVWPFILFSFCKMANLCEASEDGNLDEVKNLIKGGADVNSIDDYVMETEYIYYIIVCMLCLRRILYNV